MKRKKHPVSTTGNHPKGKPKTAGLAVEERPKNQSSPQHEAEAKAPPRAIEDAETEEQELDQNRQNQRRAETK